MELSFRKFKQQDSIKCSKFIIDILKNEKFDNEEFKQDVIAQYSPKELLKNSKEMQYYILTNKKEDIIALGGIKPKGELKTIYVNKNYQGEGYGIKITKFLIEKAKQLKLKKVFLWSSSNSINFYKKLGFKLKPKHKEDTYMEMKLS
ncbi:hypothetical protein CL617_02840 [archaeon]|nr:hypothetical protein [archaeon]|tara:strand:+ start:6790 stop:7230 length:441 start_codon:yes stop_codon:yes gene_type:complete